MKEVFDLFITPVCFPRQPPENMLNWQLMKATAEHLKLGVSETVGRRVECVLS